MYSIDRLNSLLAMTGILPTMTSAPIMIGEWHGLLDKLDRTVGIRTRHGCASAYTQGAKPFPVSEYVGARLARLERHVEASKAPAMFWLGAEGEA